MRRGIAAAAAAAVLAAPAAIAFWSGGFFDQPRLVAGVVACALLLAAAAVAERPLPRAWPGRLALAGLAALAAWTALSLRWAPLGGAALDDAQRVVLYALALAAAAAWLRGPGARAAVEPALALGALVVVGYGLAERLLPGLLELQRSTAAGGRLEQPITYWNAMGAVAVTGLVLSVRLEGDRTRAAWLRAAAAAAVPPLATGLYLTLSRGALAALGAGLLALLLVAHDSAQARAIGMAVLTGGLAAACAVALPELGAARPGGSAGAQGALMLAALAALSGAGAAAALALARRERAGRLAVGPLPARLVGPVAALLAAGLVAAALLAAASGGDGKRSRQGGAGPGAGRLRSLQSNRYDYWGVALGALRDHPLRGVGSAGFRVEWERERDVSEATLDAHSLYLETAGELGLVGLLALAALLAGVGAAATRARARAPAAAAGPIAVLAAWAFHAGFDWDWEMPAVTLFALALAGFLIALSECEPVAPAATRSRRRRAARA